MVIVFLMTAILGLALAYSFTKTQSLYLPVSLHFGWNFFNIVVFSSGPLGSQLFIKANTNKLQDGLSLIILVFQAIVLPLLIWWYLSYISKSLNRFKFLSRLHYSLFICRRFHIFYIFFLF